MLEGISGVEQGNRTFKWLGMLIRTSLGCSDSTGEQTFAAEVVFDSGVRLQTGIK